jgi:tRNA-2-methylthio-N6-dimethylallyladenosine synthase
MMKKKKLAIITLGCQMNKSDSEWLAGTLTEEYEYTEDKTEADFLVVNTCAVRDKAEQKFFSLLGRLRPLKAANKNLVIGVAGCMAQEHGEAIVQREPLVDIVFGTRAMDKAHILLRKFEETGRPQVDTDYGSDYDDFPVRRESPLSAWVPIMRGCGNHCSYCIVPSTRGPEQSRPMENLLNEVSGLIAQGYREITLLGQNVNSYGAGLGDGVDFPSLLRQIDAIAQDARVRFMTSHPKDLSDSLIGAMAELASVCPAMHLPLQSGSDKILGLMRRGYTAGRYFDRVERLRERIPDISITSDVIVGFPGETEEDFEATFRAVETARYDNIFLFKYSPRPNTPAADLPGHIPGKLAQERFDRVMTLQKEVTAKRLAEWIGRDVEVLVDGISKRDAERFCGRSPQNIVVNFDSREDFTGRLVRVRIERSGQFSLHGDILR